MTSIGLVEDDRSDREGNLGPFFTVTKIDNGQRAGVTTKDQPRIAELKKDLCIQRPPETAGYPTRP
jgi:hypothetical protein